MEHHDDGATIGAQPGWRKIADPPYGPAVAAVRTGAASDCGVRLESSALRLVRSRRATLDETADRDSHLQAPFTDSPTFANIGGTIVVWGHDQTCPPDTYAGSMRIMEYQETTRKWRCDAWTRRSIH